MTRFAVRSIHAGAAALLLTAAIGAAAQGAAAPAAPVSPAKKELVARVLQLQQSGIEALGTQIAGQTAGQVLQAVGAAMPRVPADKREAVFNQVQADVRKFHDDIAPMLRTRAARLAPTTLGTALEEKFSEEELKSLVAWLESPTSRKFQQVAGEVQQSFAQKLVADTRPQVEPKLKALEESIAAKLNAAGGGASAPAGAAPKKAEPAAKK